MSNHAKLSASIRTETGSTGVKAVRARGSVPANIYGATVAPANLEINRRQIEQVLAHAAGENLLVDLEINPGNGKSESRLALIQEVQHHPVSREILHVDFHAVSATENIEAEIPIETVGEADGVKNFGGILEVIVRALPIRCLPKDLPEIIRVDVSALKVGESIHVRDIVLPEGVEAAMDADVTVIAVAEPNVAQETTTEGPAAPEVLKEKKTEEAAAKS